MPVRRINTEIEVNMIACFFDIQSSLYIRRRDSIFLTAEGK